MLQGWLQLCRGGSGRQEDGRHQLQVAFQLPHHHHGKSFKWHLTPYPPFGKNITDFWGYVDVCGFWFLFMVKYWLNMKDNL